MSRNCFRALCLLVLVALGFTLSAPAQAQCWYVSKYGTNAGGTSWVTAFTTIAAAVVACQAGGGGDIWVQRGIYNERITIATDPTDPNGPVRLYGGFHGWEDYSVPGNFNYRNFCTNPTVIDGGHDGSVVTFVGSTVPQYDRVLDGFWIRNGDNTNLGGGVSIEDASAIVANNVIINNKAGDGGGIGIHSYLPSLITANTIGSDSAMTALGGGGHGGGIFCLTFGSGRQIQIVGNRIGETCCLANGNQAEGSGGGIYLLSGGGNHLISHNTVWNNHAGLSGGGVYLGYTDTYTDVWNNHIQGNNIDTSVSGAGMMVEYGSANLINNTIYESGVGSSACGLAFRSAVGISMVYNCIVAGNGGWQIRCSPAGSAVSSTSCVWEPTGLLLYFGLVPGLGDIQSDPILDDPCGASPNGSCIAPPHLVNDPGSGRISPCIDAGSNTMVPADLVRDLDGEVRIDPTTPRIVDMGADEYWDPGIILNVPSMDYPSIQSALINAGPNRRIQLAAGSYSENIVMKPCVTLSGDPAMGTAIAGSVMNTVVTVPVGVRCNLDHLGIVSGHAIQGGGINVGMCAKAYFDHCAVAGNLAEMDQSIFSYDPIGTGAGGGMYWARRSSGVLGDSCMIWDNRASGVSLPSVHGMGGGLAIEDGAFPIVSRSRIYHNVADWDGGGIWVFGGGARPFVQLCHIYSNIASWGGGVYVRATANPVLCNNKIIENAANTECGGVFVYEGGIGEYLSNTIANNTSVPAGTPTQVEFVPGAVPSTFINNIVYDGITPGPSQAGIPAWSTSIPERHNNDFWPTPEPFDLNVLPGLNALYDLVAGSPCINVGDTPRMCTTVDINNDPRVANLIIDLGADEYIPPSAAAPCEASRPLPFGLTRRGSNPAPGSVGLEFTLPSSGVVRLTVHDVQGRLLRTLVHSWQAAGRHDLRWDGLTASGNRAPSGVYYLRLTDVGHEAEAKIVLTH